MAALEVWTITAPQDLDLAIFQELVNTVRLITLYSSPSTVAINKDISRVISQAVTMPNKVDTMTITNRPTTNSPATTTITTDSLLHLRNGVSNHMINGIKDSNISNTNNHRLLLNNGINHLHKISGVRARGGNNSHLILSNGKVKVTLLHRRRNIHLLSRLKFLNQLNQVKSLSLPDW